MKQYRDQARKSMESTVKAHGGTLKAGDVSHPDAAEDRSMVKSMVKPEALSGRAKGGASPKKGGTKVNVIVAPRVGNRPVPVPVPVSGSAAGPSGVGPSRPLVQPAAPNSLAGLNAPQEGLKRGGRPRRASGGKVGKFDAGAGSGVGRIEKTEHQKRRK